MKKQTANLIILLIFLFQINSTLKAQTSKLTAETFSGLEFRSLGPALTSGRIADIAIHPKNESLWYVAVGSGGVWKTTNAGTTWSPVFDKQTTYSIGCVTIDPNNHETIWVGSGENVGGRHAGYGDGIYVSYNGGTSWKNMGLKNSEHISKIIIHPEDSNIIWVAVQGPLWSQGGDRGLYKSIDGGKNWNKTLGDAVWTGVTDILLDQNNSEVLYAATWDRHRTVAAYMGGGPGSGIHKSHDGGNTWTKLTEGIPKSNLGKIGLAISPFNSNVIYAAIELDRTKGGVYMTENGGVSWNKQSDAVSGGTGPHYYQELYASPHHKGKLYLMSNTVQISDDHGKNFSFMNEEKKHVDSHAMAFKSSDPNYVLFGTDGGLYESFDLTKSWKYFRNLPITQYYKVAVDDSEPFYNIYGGTQDNGSHGGPSQTRSEAGISNSDWWITLGADGHQSATEPGNPDITYGEFQQGWLWRIDQTTGETVYIQPQPSDGDPYERFNWDAPILVSPHNPTRLYFASYRVWKSENRGDEWTAISNDLTRNEERLSLPIMGKQQSWDNAWDVGAMSVYNTISSLAESPIQEGLIYAGTDDGILQVTEDGGINWRKIMLGSIKGVPNRAFVNDVRADLIDANTVYLTLDNHKEGDYKPYLLKSTDKGKTWSFINGDLPYKLITWRLVQDHKKKDLLFAATELGVYFTNNGGQNWVQLKGGLPTISFRDITIQRREDDLVGATFGRGFYVLDDLSPLRAFNPTMLQKEASLFPVKTANWYMQKQEIYGQGNSEYLAKNPSFGATFTYYLPDSLKTLKVIRQEKEQKLIKQNNAVSFPGWQALEDEKNQSNPRIIFTIKDADGQTVNTVEGTNKKGFNRVAWDLSYADRTGIKLAVPKMMEDDFLGNAYLATPGTYTATMYKQVDGITTQLADPESFAVRLLEKGALPSKPHEEIASFRDSYQKFKEDLTATNTNLNESKTVVNAMMRALDQAKQPTNELTSRIYATKQQLLQIDKTMNGSTAKNEVGERNSLSPNDGSFIGTVALRNTYGPTANHRAALNRAKNQLSGLKSQLKTIVETTIPALEQDLKSAGAPYIEGQGLIKN